MPVEVLDFDFDTPAAAGKQAAQRNDEYCLIKATVSKALPVVGATAALSLQLLAMDSDHDGLVTMSAKQLANRLGLSWQSGVVIFRRLRKHGFIERTAGGSAGEASTHRVTLDPQPI